MPDAHEYIGGPFFHFRFRFLGDINVVLDPLPDKGELFYDFLPVPLSNIKETPLKVSCLQALCGR